jgi:phosphoglycolate phosphatase-like HAD superfamily hydrolase
MRRLVLFDIDGTLLLSGGAGLESLRRVFRELFEVDDPIDGVPVHGRTDPEIVQAIARRSLGRELERAELEELGIAYLRHLERFLEHEAFEFRVLPGASELVQRLARRSEVLLGLATGNFEPAAFAKLRRAGLEPYFGFGGFGSDSHDRAELTKLAVRRGRERAGPGAPAVVVGDTIHDVESAFAAGAECLAVATGRASLEELAEAGATWVVPDLLAPEVEELLFRGH